MIFIPLLDRIILPAWSKWSERSSSRCGRALYPSALRRIGCGMVLASSAFVMSAFVSSMVSAQGKGKVNIAWIIPQYALLTFGEILTSTTGKAGGRGGR